MHTKQTKIICTVADYNCEPKFIQQLLDIGMNVIRLNTAHIDLKTARKMVKNIRKVSDRIGILIDTKGPEVRSCNIETPIEVKTGDEIFISNTPTDDRSFQVNFEDFVSVIPVGSSILIDDGELKLTVKEKTDEQLTCIVENDGVIKNKKSLNVPNVHLDLPSLTEKDAQFIDWSTQNDIDFIAHSFVRSRDDVMAIKSILQMRKSNIKIIAKIENQEGVDNLEEILDEAHGVMVARGDLGIEIPASEVPVIQKKIIHTCIRRIKPVITATQMLHSMIENPRATRAEVSDVANAILDGTDAIMLSGETAYGKFPLESVQTMSNIAHAVEQQKESLLASSITPQANEENILETHLAKSAVTCLHRRPVQAIVASTRSGGTALLCSAYRKQTPIFAFSESLQVVRMLSMSYGVYAAPLNPSQTTEQVVKSCLTNLLDEGKINMDDAIVFLGGGHIYSHHTNFMQVETPAILLGNNSDDD